MNMKKEVSGLPYVVDYHTSSHYFISALHYKKFVCYINPHINLTLL
jgi:hypothetical protein